MACAAREPPRLTLFAGPNGSGKSTAYRRFVEAGLEGGEYLNPDDAVGTGRLTNYEAASLVLRRCRALIAAGTPFCRETTLAGREILRTVRRAADAGYRVALVYVGIEAALGEARVAFRHRTGGHDIPVPVQRRRFARSMANAAEAARLADRAWLLDNSGSGHRLVAALREGAVTFADTARAPWAAALAAGFPDTGHLRRDEALRALRESVGLGDDLQVHERSVT